MKTILVLLCSLLVTAVSAITLPTATSYLLPTPKEVRFTERQVFSGNRYVLEDQVRLPETERNLIHQQLRSHLGWQPASQAPIRLRLNQLPSTVSSQAEYYTLDIEADVITIAAPHHAGIMRGLGRLYGIIQSPLTTLSPEGVLSLPGLRIADYPDFPLRSIMLPSAALFPHSTKRQLFQFVEEFIDQAAAMQFNCICFEIGGRLQVKGYPHFNPPGPVYTPDELSVFVRRAQHRGFKLIPWFNTIGHLARAPQICLTDVTWKGKKRQVMNIAHPDFWPQYTAYLDAIIQAFDGPEFICIGTDEFHREQGTLAKLCGKPFHQYYPEFVNRVHDYLQGKGVKLMIQHDMLQPMGLHPYPDEVGSGPSEQGLKALNAINKDVHVLYWNYFHSYTYHFLGDLQRAGIRNIWLEPHSGAQAVKALLKRGWTMKAPPIATTWFLVLQSNCFPHAAEYTWNIKDETHKTEHDFNEHNDALFYSRGCKIRPASPQCLKLTGGFTPDQAFTRQWERQFPGNRASASGIPMDFTTMRALNDPRLPLERSLTPQEALKAQADKKKVFLKSDYSVEASLVTKLKLNQPRTYQDLVVYDRTFGNTTKTNNRGLEIVLDSRQRVLRTSGNCRQMTGDEKGNASIPAGGSVLSYGNSQPYLAHPGYGLFFNLHPQERMQFVTDNDTAVPATAVTASLEPDRRTIAVAITCTQPARQQLLGTIILTLDDGTRRRCHVAGSHFIKGTSLFLAPPGVRRFLPWQLVRYRLRPAIVYEMTIPHSKGKPQKLTIIPTRHGQASGLTVLGATQF